MANIFIDFESTGVNPYTSEIIEGYFLKEDGSDFLMKCRPYKWSKEAERIHGIKKETADQYGSFKDEFRRLLKWLPKEFTFVCYANPNTDKGYVHYDYTLLYNSVHILFCHQLEKDDLWWSFRNEYKITPYSVHTLAKESHNNGNITVPLTIKAGNKKRSQDFSQENIARILGYEYKTHNCIEDVKALKFIYEELE